MKNILKYIVIVLITFFSFSLKLKAISNIIVNESYLIPYFNKDIRKYNVFVAENTTSINIDYIKEETDDYVEGIGKINLELGINKLEIKVYKLDDTFENYQIYVYRGYNEIYDYESATLTNLEITGHDIDFDENKYEYLINISKEETDLEINYELKSEYSDVKLIGNSNLLKEQNVITITVTSKDEKTTNIYTIKVNKVISTFKEDKEVIETNDFTKKDNIITILIIVLSNILIVFIQIKILFTRKNRVA